MAEQRAQGRHAGLTKQQVVDAAVRLADSDGAAALSMRKVARELGVEAMTLYHHVPNKQALEDAIVEHVLDEALESVSASGPWERVVSDYGSALHDGLQRHPGAAALFASRPAITERTMDQVEALLEVLHDAGFTPRDALLVVYAVAGAVIGHHASGRAADDAAAPSTDVGVAGGRPLFSAAAADGPVDTQERLAFTLRALVDGLRVRLAAL
ncbi:transcriptional regulator, TetR family [Beutenbergia cavernae DSM 12333]|uniref:Transcriptional regulator, TetR family n=1 Tax=Beutenbergia cavernae (strain ATCC BAA-8 / DSM 12333 / CCUG 43141 / JCM 11478 / NBRC 16432 / NCIMB 13614 / HKI 0122) TaxID=471853 RepID=C5C4L0_BEUC1|nr:TetR/AcrR family transcriptional regulator C-terminal domain-containing protein [Beutenbergia cavernae]ACQ82134.1 transcriptional regulator, TetR family [Beutenbergia cavernae DSM 12333]